MTAFQLEKQLAEKGRGPKDRCGGFSGRRSSTPNLSSCPPLKKTKIEEEEETTTDFPKCTVGLDGSFVIESAPERALFPLAWLVSSDRSSGKIKTEKDIVSFLPTEGDTIRYRIVSFDTDTYRFVGERIQ